MVDEEFIEHEAERLYQYFKARSLIFGSSNFPNIDSLKIIIKELCEIAEMEGNASDAFIQVFVNQNGNLVVRPIVKIQKKNIDIED